MSPLPTYGLLIGRVVTGSKQRVTLLLHLYYTFITHLAGHHTLSSYINPMAYRSFGKVGSKFGVHPPKRHNLPPKGGVLEARDIVTEGCRLWMVWTPFNMSRFL